MPDCICAFDPSERRRVAPRPVYWNRRQRIRGIIASDERARAQVVPKKRTNRTCAKSNQQRPINMLNTDGGLQIRGLRTACEMRIFLPFYSIRLRRRDLSVLARVLAGWNAPANQLDVDQAVFVLFLSSNGKLRNGKSEKRTLTTNFL